MNRLENAGQRTGAAGREIPAADLVAIAASTTLATFLLASDSKRPGRALAGGMAAGVSLGILYALQIAGVLITGERDRKTYQRSMVSKLIKKIPMRVKAATIVGGVGGAVKSGGREAGREIKGKVRESLSRKK